MSLMLVNESVDYRSIDFCWAVLKLQVIFKPRPLVMIEGFQERGLFAKCTRIKNKKYVYCYDSIKHNRWVIKCLRFNACQYEYFVY